MMIRIAAVASATLWWFLPAPLAAQGIVRQVGPTRAFADIQAAVNAAANGDVIEVDPGTYAPFVIQGKQLAVIGNQSSGAGAVFTVSGAPAITVTGLQPFQQVTIAHARATATAAAPAIVITGNGLGHVRLLAVEVLSNSFGPVAYDGLIEVRDVESLWCDRVRAGDYRYRCNGAAGTAGLAALFVDSTPVQLTRTVLQGNRSDAPSIEGGDAIAIRGSDSLWAVDCHLVGGQPPVGAWLGVLGGHAVHDVGGSAGSIRCCATVLLTTDPAASAVAVQGAPSFLMACLPDTIARTELPLGVTELALGSTTPVTVRAEVGNQAFVLLLGTGFGSIALPNLLGELVVGGDLGILTGGLITGPVAIPIAIPLQPSLVGLQGVLQSVLVGAASAFSAATAAGFTIR
ncbi:MAG: hypothetical protein MUC36_04915 [Planctomycetes bacterium]|jgi:hypothetical protein|nr:hypothetical protein [Planctomycetota bacterium]